MPFLIFSRQSPQIVSDCGERQKNENLLCRDDIADILTN